ncbi:Cysteine-rich protein 2 [Collichthys lucidus]|uniref:Cysteine-rich protein 2 n=1 Tax=Collichthys lucidus TaxID=240159 RepID=A0A4U5VIL8_COLLU|nr:Cysteine-rich protein 2 [Collichthys lucidus]
MMNGYWNRVRTLNRGEEKEEEEEEVLMTILKFEVIARESVKLMRKHGRAEKVSSLGKDWHKLCLKCDRCNKLLNAGGHAELGVLPHRSRCLGSLLGSGPPWLPALISAEESRSHAPAVSAAFPACISNRPSIAWLVEKCKSFLDTAGVVIHDGRPYCHKPCYAALFGPKGVNIGGAGSYVYDTPANNNPSPTCVDSAPKAEEKRVFAPKAASKAGGITTFSGEANLCPRCNKKVYFGVNTGGVGSYIYEKEPSAVTQP